MKSLTTFLAVLIALFTSISQNVNAQVRVETFAGTPGVQNHADGPLSSALFSSPTDVTADSLGNIYISEATSHVIRKISPSGQVSTFIGDPDNPGYFDGSGNNALFRTPQGIIYGHDGYLYIADAGNNCIRRADLNGNVTTFAGDTAGGYLDGPAATARFKGVMGLTMAPNGDIFAADAFNYSIRRITQSGIVTTVAGDTIPGYQNGTGSAARFNVPTSIVIDENENLFVSDHINSSVRMITPAGVVTTYAGDTISSYQNGYRTAARFNTAFFLSISSEGDLYLSDQGNWVIRHLSTDDTVNTLAGNTIYGHNDSTGEHSQFSNVSGLFVHGNKALYAADYNNRVVRKIYAIKPEYNINKSTICKGDNITITASGGTEYRWYDDEESDVPIHTGSTFNPPPLYENTTYYLANAYKGLESERVEINLSVYKAPLNFHVNECVHNAENYTALFINFTQGVFNFDYMWQFGDGYTTSDIHPEHQFSQSGYYEVTLAAKHKNNQCHDTITKEILVKENPEVTISAGNVCVNSNVPLNSMISLSYSSDISYEWDFGNGTQSELENPEHSYNFPGEYIITLKATSDSTGCSSEAVDTVTIYSNPMPDFSAVNSCTDAPVSFTDETQTLDAIQSYHWNFNNEATSQDPNPVYTFTDSGSKSITLTATTINGCSDSTTKLVNVKPKPEVSLAIAESACMNEPVTLSASVDPAGTSYNYSWNFGDGETSEDESPEYTWNTHGDFTVSLTVETGDGCKDSAQQIIEITPLPEPSFTAEGSCLGETTVFTNTTTGPDAQTYSYNWNFGDNNQTSENDPEHTYSSTGEYDVTLYATSQAGCSDFVTQSHQIFDTPDAEFAYIAENNKVSFTPEETGYSVYHWDFGDNNTSSGTEPEHTFETAGTYTVTLTVTDENGCQSTSSKTIDVIVSLPIQEEKPEINVYPVPAANKLFIESNDITGPISITLYDMQGRKVGQYTDVDLSKPYELELNNHKPGSYFIIMEQKDRRFYSIPITVVGF